MAAQPKALPLEQASYLEGGGIYGWLTTIDHKRVAILYGITAAILLAFGGTEAMLVRAQLIVPSNHFLSAQAYNQFFTMHGLTMIFLVVMPLETGFFGNFFIPLQIGARDVAFPRLNALSYWIFLFGAITLESRLDLGRTAQRWMVRLRESERALLFAGPQYRLLRHRTAHPRRLLGDERAQFLRHHHQYARARHDLHAHADVYLVAAGHRHPDPAGLPGADGGPDLSVRGPLFRRPFLPGDRGRDADAVAASVLDLRPSGSLHHVLPAFGMISEVLPVFSRKPLFGYPMMAYSIMLIAFLSYGVWGHHMFATGMGPVADSAFSITSMLIAIPTGVKVFSWIATVWGGRLRFTTADAIRVGVYP